MTSLLRFVCCLLAVVPCGCLLGVCFIISTDGSHQVHYCNASTFDIEVMCTIILSFVLCVSCFTASISFVNVQTHKIFAQDSDHVFVGGFVTGHVVQLGTDVDTTRFHVDCLVIGYVPLDHGSSILSEYCICPEWRCNSDSEIKLLYHVS